MIAKLLKKPFTAQSASSVCAPADARELVAFWQDGGKELWFGKNVDLDRRLAARFLPWHEMAARGELAEWAATATGALALTLLLDQFPRNSFRGTARMYDTDAMARKVAAAALAQGHDRAVPGDLRLFFYLPFAHS